MRRAINIISGIFWFLGLVGLATLPEDFQVLTDRLGWAAILLSRDNILIALFALSALGFAWVVFQPTIRRRLASRKHKVPPSITIEDFVVCEARALPSQKLNINLYANEYFLTVANNAPDGKTLRNVQARVYFGTDYVIGRVRDTRKASTDIRHGEIAQFRIGRLVSEIMGGMIAEGAAFDRNIGLYENNVPQKFYAFEVGEGPTDRGFWLSNNPQTKDPWHVLIIVSADDILSRRVTAKVDMTDLVKPVSLTPVANQA